MRTCTFVQLKNDTHFVNGAHYISQMDVPQKTNNMEPLFQFDLPKEQSSIIKVFGVGGGGGNAVNYMFDHGIIGVNFVVLNTDEQALTMSRVPNKIQLGPALTRGLGAGSNPEVGGKAAEESEEVIRELLGKNTKMVFITAGMGGGTGTGAAPVVARIAREMDILTVGIVTTPFWFEGKGRHNSAVEGIERLRQHVDTLLIIDNDRIRQMYGNLTRSQGFAHANNILTTAAKAISEIITVPGEINVDFADVYTVMKNGGSAVMGCASADGEDRASIAVTHALNSPLLNHSSIKGARKVLVNITTGTKQVTMDEIGSIMEYVQESAGSTDIILGACDDPSLGEKLSVTIIATGFEVNNNLSYGEHKTYTVYELNSTKESEVVQQEAPAVTTVEPVVTVTEKAEEVVSHNLSIEDIVGQTQEPTLFTGVVETEVRENVVEFEVTPEQQNLTFAETVSEKVVEEDLSSTVKEKEEADFVLYQRSGTVQNSLVDVTPEELENTLLDRKKILGGLSFKPSAKNIHELEEVPAYMRRDMEIDDSKSFSSDEETSRYSVKSGSSISTNNSYLHDNVD